jgi:hypothetical protein
MKTLLCNTVDPIPSLQGQTVCGGRVNVVNALRCEAGDVTMGISPSDGFIVPIDQEAVVTVSLAQCASSIVGANVAISPNNGDDSFLAHDDGVAPDAHAGDGTYSASWTPRSGGPVTLAVEATFDGGSLVDSVTGEVIEVPQYVVYAVDSPSSWIDATQGTNAGAIGDDDYVEIPIGFDFAYYGITHDMVKISSNGFLAFGSDGVSSFINDPIPWGGAPNDIIAPLWDDLNPSQGGAVYYLLAGQAPNRSLTVAWVDVPYYGTTGSATFEVTLVESGSQIIFQYLDVESGDYTRTLGRSATVGIEDGAGITGLEFSFDQPAIRNGMLIWIREAPECDDGRDNDDDGLIDYPDDPQCVSAFDDDEERVSCGLLGIEILIVGPVAWAMRLRRRQHPRKKT